MLTAVLGDEYDDELRGKVIDLLRKLGAKSRGEPSWYLAGAQEIEELDVEVEGQQLHIEAETYMGLSITGPDDLVKRIQELVSQ